MPANRLLTVGICIALGLALLAGAAEAQTAPPTRDDIVGKLNHFEQPAEIDRGDWLARSAARLDGRRVRGKPIDVQRAHLRCLRGLTRSAAQSRAERRR